MVGVNTSAPKASLDVIGAVRFPSVVWPGKIGFLSVNNNGFLVSTGNLNHVDTQWAPTSSLSGVA